MSRAMLRTGTFRKVKVKVVSGVKTHFKRRKPARAKCGKCGKVLLAVPNEIPSKMQNMPKTAKRPERPYGGKLCSKCMRELIKENVRK
jgi:large subunit ribosomal protein L34e